MEDMLGKEHEMVGHAIIPYVVGGGLDLYYYLSGLPGTAIATKELSELLGEGSSNSVFGCYELVMFTKQLLDSDIDSDNCSPFGRMHSDINAILNCIARYSAEVTLEPAQTCEFPDEMPRIGGRCLIFDGYPGYCEDKQLEFGLLAVIEVFRSEMNYAMEVGGERLLKRLKSKGHYPYSDLDRRPVA